MPSRRQLLTAVGAGSLSAVAGCAGTTVGGPADPPPPSSPDLTPDRHVYGADGEWSSFGCNASNTRAVHDGQAPVDGVSERWRVELPQLGQTAPVAAGGRVYLPGEQLRALDAANGTEQWRVAGVETAPVVRDGVVYASVADTSRVVALEADTGDRIWSRPFDPVPKGPSMYPGEPLLVGAGETVSALDPATGEPQWSRRLFGEVLGHPPVLSGFFAAVATAAGEVSLLGLEDGQGARRWRLPATPTGPPAADSDTVYVTCRDGTTYALGGDSVPRGEVAWTADTGWTPRGLGVTDGLVAAGTAGELHAVDADSGEVQWTHEIGDWRQTAPAIGRETLFVGGDRLWALATTAEGTTLGSGPGVRFEREFYGRVGPGPVLNDGTLYVVAQTGEAAYHLLALE
jgi:outer membrane protein assembly factor BamB